MNSKTVLTAVLGGIAGIGLVMGTIAFATDTGRMGNTQGGGMMGQGGGMMGQGGGMMGKTTQQHTTTPGPHGTMQNQTTGKTTPGTMHGQAGKTGTHGTMHGQAGKTGAHGTMHGQAGPQNQPARTMPHASADQTPGNTTCPGGTVGKT